MNNFIFCNPTKLVFGKNQISQLANLIPADKNLMLTFGGGSVKSNGIYEQVTKALAGRKYVEFWGIEPNPQIGTLRKAITLGREHNINFILAVGGGSVLDGTKLIAAGLKYDGDAWDLVLKGHAPNSVDFASVLTLPATGSEMNAGAVISDAELNDKRSFYSRYPVFSILDPQATYSLPKYQIACGLADTFVHVMEQYLTTPGQSRIMDRWAEGILQTVIEIAPQVLNVSTELPASTRKTQTDYDLMADFMLSATMALNDFIRMGITQDWATHMIGHEITALCGITHGETLAIVLGGTLRTLKAQKKAKLLQYATRVWNITGTDDDAKADKAIAKTEDFFRSLGLCTRLKDKNIGDDVIDKIQAKFNAAGVKIGEGGNITGDVVRQILVNCK